MQAHLDIPAPDVPATSAKKKRNWLAWLLVAAVCGLLLLPLLHRAPAPAKMGFPGPGGPPGAAGATIVTTSPVRSGTMQIYLDALGTVTPQATVNVYSQVSGRIMSVNYQEGQMVRKGQVLAEIDPRPTQAQLEQAQGSLLRDRASLEQARTNARRYQDALKEHAIAEQTASDQESTVRQDEGTVANDEGSVRYYQVQLDYCRIVAPISGRIGLRLVDAGNTIFSGSSSTIATITQIDPITVVFSVAEDHLEKIEQQLRTHGHALSVELYDRAQTTRIATGKLLGLDNQVDTTTGTVKLRALFTNSTGALFPNQFVNARLQVSTLQNASLIPTSAVQYNGQQAFVYIMKPDSTAALHNITVINAEGPDTAISGLNVGDSVITSNFDRLQDGAKVMAPPTMGMGPNPGAARPPSAATAGPAK